METKLAKASQTYIILKEMCKSFGVTKALDNANLEIRLGEITGLIGPNGAGKSTLMKILTGLYLQDSGELIFPTLGGPAKKYNANIARENGIYCAYQELSVCSNLAVYENFLLNKMTHTPLGKPGFRRNAMTNVRSLLDNVFPDHNIDVSASIDTLPMVKRQMVEICKAVDHDNLKVLILDEPTSSLPTERINQLLDFLRKLCQKNIAVIYISHKLDEISKLCHTVNILRNGTNTGTSDVSKITMEEMITLLGGECSIKDKVINSADVEVQSDKLLEISRLTTKLLHDINMNIYKGEIVGISGLDGGGQADLLRTIFDLVLNHKLKGSKYLKIAYVSGDRASEGILPHWNIGENIAIASSDKIASRGLVNPQKIMTFAQHWFEEFAIRAQSVKDEITGLSGGNQQKVLIARGLATEADILLLNDPTRGVDIGTKHEIYRIMREAKAAGKTIVLFSTEDTEMCQCDRVYIMHEGTIVNELSGDILNEQNIIKTAFEWKSKTKDNNGNRADKKQTQLSQYLHYVLGSRALISIVTLTVLYSAISFMKPAALTYMGINLIYSSVIPLVLVALSQMFISIGGGIDMGSSMSVGLTTVIIAQVVSRNLGLGIVLLIGLIIGYGLMGLLILKTRIPAVIVTLGFSFVWQGLAVIISPVPGGICPSWIKAIFNVKIPGIPSPIILACIASLATFWIVRRSKYGIVMNAVGNNPTVAERSGWSIVHARVVAYMISGVLVILSGMSMTAIQGSGDYSSTGSFTMIGIAIFILGGCEFLGAYSSPIGVVIASFAIMSISTLLTFLKMNSNLQTMITGLVLIAAMFSRKIISRNGSKT